jgi:DNA-binding CsgD family transcriptional regulator
MTRENIINSEPKQWTPDEIEQIHPVTPSNEPAGVFNRATGGVLDKTQDSTHSCELPWTDVQIEELRRLYPVCSYREIAVKLNHSLNSVQAKIQKLGLARQLKQKGIKRKTAHYGRWTPEEIDLIKKLCPVKSCTAIARQLGRSIGSVSMAISKIRQREQEIPAYRTEDWSEEDCAFVKENIGKLSLEEIAQKLGRSVYAVERTARKMNCIRKDWYAWSKQEIRELKSLFPNHSMPEMADILGRSLYAVMAKIKELGLKKLKAWTDKDLAILKKYFPIEPCTQVARRLNRSATTIFNKAHQLGLRKSIYVKYGAKPSPQSYGITCKGRQVKRYWGQIGTIQDSHFHL